jgi:hypothetical protein
MKITIEFNLPEEQEVYENFSQSGPMRTALHKFDQYLRSKTKYAPDSVPNEILQAYMDVRATFNELTEGLII